MLHQFTEVGSLYFPSLSFSSVSMTQNLITECLFMAFDALSNPACQETEPHMKFNRKPLRAPFFFFYDG